MRNLKLKGWMLVAVMGCAWAMLDFGAVAAEATTDVPDTVSKKADIPDVASMALIDALGHLHTHIRGEVLLEDAVIASLTKRIKSRQATLPQNEAAIRKAQAVVKDFDAMHGPLWVKHPPLHSKKQAEGDTLRWAVFWVMQQLMDELYNAEGLREHRALLDGFRFGSADHFPGRVDAVPDPDSVHTVKIQAGYPETWGSPVMHMERPARKPTGTYLVPGTIATVTVPEELVGKGYQVRVGAHSWDHTRKPRVLRLYRVSALYDIDSTEVEVANPLGGGIYIEVPYKSEAGVVTVSVRHAVRAPYFSLKPFHRTTNAEWQEVERHHPAPWADFQSERYMMQVPTSWVYALDDAETLMQNWDKALDVCSDLMGRPRAFGREILYNQVDLQLRGGAFHPGYPSGNRGYDPTEETDGYSKHHLVRGPQIAHNYEFHELGHAFLFPKYAGDREAVVNLPHVAVMNLAFGKDMHEAFRGSRFAGASAFKTVETAAIAWMMSDSFVESGFMKNYERAYQLKGHAKYVDIARLFGWEALGRFFRATQEAYMAGNPWPRNASGEEGDAYTIGLSEAAGADLRPLLHFWGIPIVNAEAADAAIRAAGIKSSAKVYDLLVGYQQLIPADKAAFRAYALAWWDKQPSAEGFTTERNHAARWESYDAEQARQAQATVQAILDRYFPEGRPAGDTARLLSQQVRTGDGLDR